MPNINTALAEYELVDELRKLPIRDASKLARAAMYAADTPPPAESLERLSSGAWERLINELSIEACQTAVNIMGSYHGTLEILDDDGKKAVLDSLDTEDVVEALKAEYDLDALEGVAELLDDDMREALTQKPEANEQAPVRLFFVYQAMPRVRRAKKQRVFRNVVAAANPDEAIDKVRGDRKMLHACSWHAEEIEGPFAAIDWTLE